VTALRSAFREQIRKSHARKYVVRSLGTASETERPSRRFTKQSLACLRPLLSLPVTALSHAAFEFRDIGENVYAFTIEFDETLLERCDSLRRFVCSRHLTFRH
jgi:hypothetical protein